MTLATPNNASRKSDNTPPALGQRVARGFAWMILVTMGSKVINIGGQIVLAWLLLKRDFGLAGLAFTVSAVANVLQQTGQREVLVQRQRRLGRWINPAVWMSAASGLAAGLLMAAAAPIAARLYDAPQVTPLVLILAVASPLYTLGTVPTAILQIQLRFKVGAFLWFGQAAMLMGLSILFALLGYGAYSFVLPWPIMSLVRLVVLWAIVRPTIRWNPQFRHWRYMIADSAMLFVARACLAVIGQADRIVLGMFCSEDVVGTYWFAFNLSMQTIMLLSFTLDGVLFPSLSKLQDDPIRQRDGFLNAARLLAMVGIPACMLQAALADPVIHAVFDAKWHSAIPILQVLSLGMLFRLVGWPSQSLIQAQGRFRAFMILCIAGLAVFVAFVALGAWAGAAVGVAIAAAAYLLLEGPVTLYAGIRAAGGTWRNVARVYVPAILLGACAVGVAALAGRLVPPMKGQHWLRLAVIAGTAAAAFLVLARMLMPGSWNAMFSRLRQAGQRGQAPEPGA